MDEKSDFKADRWNHPVLGFGIGLRYPHYQHILENEPDLDFFEIISENFLQTRGRQMYILDEVAERYPIIMHGVSLSIGSCDPLNWEYLSGLKKLKQRIGAKIVSDHLCFTGINRLNSHDLLPIPYTESSLKYVVERVKIIQDYLECPLVLENASSYMEYRASQMPEWEFLVRMTDDADCSLLLDVNNVFVSCSNHGWDSQAYIEAIPAERIAYQHLAGHTVTEKLRIDTHNDHVPPGVWELFRKCEARTGGRTTLLEWDEDIPSFEIVYAEAQKAREESRASLGG